MAVESVNGKTGVVVLTAANVEAVPASEVTVIAGESMGVGEGALSALAAVSKVEQEKHHSNTALGYHALHNLKGTAGTSTEDNVAIGAQALEQLTTGGGNVAVGEHAGFNLTTGEENIAVGCESLASNKTETGNVAVGFRTLNQLTGGKNIAIGYKALELSTVGSLNVAMGHEAMHVATESSGCVAIGTEAGLKLTTGSSNVLVGEGAGEEVTSGKENTFLGGKAGNSVTGAGSQNVCIGYHAGHTLGEASKGNICLGTNSGPAAETKEENQLYLHNAASGEPLIFGNFGTRELRFFTEKLGFFKHAAVAQPAKPAETTAAIIKVLEELGLCA